MQQEEISELPLILDTQKTELTTDDTITGFNIGMNMEKIRDKQFSFSAYLRRKGDTNNPRGGIRGVIPEKQIY